MNEVCEAHLARTGKRIPAERVIAGEGMCRDCFRGRSIDPLEERFGLPFPAADALNGSTPQAQVDEKNIGKGEPA
jgi:hypothetical protein